MRRWLNVPLFVAFLANARGCAVAIDPPRGGDAALGAAFEIVFETGIAWLMLAVVLAACGGMGGYRWPRVLGFAGVMTGLMGWLGVLLVSLSAIGIAIEFGTIYKGGATQAAMARLVAFGLPFLIVLYGGWIANAPAPARDRRSVHAGFLGLAGLMCLIALAVTVGDLGVQSREAEQAAAARGRQEDARDDEMRRQFAALTDANSLFEWSAWLGDNVPKDVQAEAVRRVAARPDLEAELAQSLRSGNPAWSREGLTMILRLKFTPSPALAAPVADAIGAIAERLTREAPDITFDGDKRIDRYERYTIAEVLEVAVRMAEAAHVDLGDAVEATARAVALYPKSEAARSYPAAAAATRKRIGQILAAGR